MVDEVDRGQEAGEIQSPGGDRKSIIVRNPDIDTPSLRDLGDPLKARLWAISENLHRNELNALERSEHLEEWRKLTLEKVNAQLGHLDKPHARGKPDRGHSATAQEFGVSRQAVERAERIASIAPEAKETAREVGLADNQSALLKAAAAPNIWPNGQGWFPTFCRKPQIRKVAVQERRQKTAREFGISEPEIRFRAERRLGELMVAQRETVGLATAGRPSSKIGSAADPISRAPTLAEAGIDKHLADRARKMAAVSIRP